MYYSRLINSIIDECVSASVGGYDVEDVLRGIDTGGDLIRKKLIEIACDPRFKSTIRPCKWWDDAAQDKLEELASRMMQTRDLTGEEADRMMEDFLQSYFFSMIQKISTPPRPLPAAGGGGSGKDDGKGEEEGKEEDGEGGDEDDDLEGHGHENPDSQKSKSLGKSLERMKFIPGVDDEEPGPGAGKGKGEGAGASSEEERRVEMEFLRSIPSSLVKLAKLIGRSGNSDTQERGHFLSAAKSDIAGITVGNDLSSLLPSEVAILSGEKTQDVFFRNFVEKRLQVFASASSGESVPVQRHDGPVIICLDTSGSMKGRPAQIAAALTMAVSIVAQRQHRKVLVVKYSDDYDLFVLKNLRKQRREFINYITMFCDGGNNENEMFGWLFRDVIPKEGEFSSADVLCVSDFGWMPVEKETFALMEDNKRKGMLFYGLDITGEGLKDFTLPEYILGDGALPPQIIDSMWLWDEKRSRCTEEDFKRK